MYFHGPYLVSLLISGLGIGTGYRGQARGQARRGGRGEREVKEMAEYINVSINFFFV